MRKIYSKMKTFNYKIGGHDLVIRLDEKQGTIADFKVDGNYPTLSDEEMPAFAAVIALAIIEHEVEVVHDDEPGVITIGKLQHHTPWATPSQQMTQI